ncbi:hypothetical protein BC936DRAFT_138434 [Jimgerdemannia flammicorona]|uniref:Uncharacterized protein n=1 Tax=Jimgerdemannia flammicorona TaxID=994334 RepID=A0A433DIG4_9FUNG|nr:hypothetical protein BC936DRAFT_138434 [Jimgerdemannia flammicorona]
MADSAICGPKRDPRSLAHHRIADPDRLAVVHSDSARTFRLTSGKAHLGTYIHLFPKISLAGAQAGGWSRIFEHSPPFGKVICLSWICWMASFRNLLTGHDEVAWRLKVTGGWRENLCSTSFIFVAVGG